MLPSCGPLIIALEMIKSKPEVLKDFLLALFYQKERAAYSFYRKYEDIITNDLINHEQGFLGIIYFNIKKCILNDLKVYGGLNLSNPQYVEQIKKNVLNWCPTFKNIHEQQAVSEMQDFIYLVLENIQSETIDEFANNYINKAENEAHKYVAHLQLKEDILNTNKDEEKKKKEEILIVSYQREGLISSLRLHTENYLVHLILIVEKELKNNHKDIYNTFLVQIKNNPPYFNIEALANSQEGYIPELRRKNKTFDLAIKKYLVVAQLYQYLKTDQPKYLRIEDFRNTFEKNKAFLAESRDSLSMKFLKAIATLFSIGVASKLGIWKVKGDEFNKTIDSAFVQKEQDNSIKKKNG